MGKWMNYERIAEQQKRKTTTGWKENRCGQDWVNLWWTGWDSVNVMNGVRLCKSVLDGLGLCKSVTTGWDCVNMWWVEWDCVNLWWTGCDCINLWWTGWDCVNLWWTRWDRVHLWWTWWDSVNLQWTGDELTLRMPQACSMVPTYVTNY
jgi:hypothetical protein